MELFIDIFIIISILGLFFVIIEFPYHLAGIFIFMLIYRFNIETPFPLDVRGLFTLALFARLYIFDRENMDRVNSYLLRRSEFWIILGFSLSVLVLPILNSERFLGLAKNIILNIIALLLGFIILANEQGKKIFIISIISISLVSAADLIYTKIIGGGLNIVRIIDVILKRPIIPLNHNFPGMLSGLGLIFIYILYSRNQASKLLLFLIGSFLFIGVIISTSRSALLAIISTLIFLHFFEIDLKRKISRIIKVGLSIFALFVTFFFIYNLFLKSPLKDQFVDKMYYRLYGEPLQLIGMGGFEYDIYTGKKIEGSIRFRIEKWINDFDKYTEFDLKTQIFGLGPGKYSEIARKEWGMWDNLKRQIIAHNGYLILLVERGLLGFLLYFLILFTVTISALKIAKIFQLITPVIYLYLYIAVYSFTQNSELIGVYTYLIFGGVLGNMCSYQKSEEAAGEEYYNSTPKNNIRREYL